MTKKVLLISPYFPPHKAIGTKRAINFVQGVHNQDDWEVIVLASRAFNENVDIKLNDHIPDGVKVDYGFVGGLRSIIKFFSGSSKKPSPESLKKADTKNIKVSKAKKGSLTPFDQYLWDVRSAIASGKRLIKEHKPDVIWVNADPWSGFIVAHKLSKHFNIPWVADMRDPWSVFQLKMDLRPKLTQKLIRYFEKKYFLSASKVVLNSEAAFTEYKRTYSSPIIEKLTYIRNAFNPVFLPEGEPRSKNEQFTFGYFGGFRSFVPSDFLLKGFKGFIDKKKLTPSEVLLEVTGSVYDEFWLQVEQYGLSTYVKVNKSINAEKTIPLLRSWDVLLLTAIHDLRWQMPAKFYDYLFARKPILAVSDYDELNDLIEKTNSGDWAKTQDDSKIIDLFESFYLKETNELLDNEDLIATFNSKEQASRFREVLEDVRKT